MVKPKNLKAIELADIRRCKQGDIFFNVFCNLSKFMSYETRDPFLVFQENQGNPLTYVISLSYSFCFELGVWSDRNSIVFFAYFSSLSCGCHLCGIFLVFSLVREWQKFARIEYDRMALEDDSVDDIGGDPGEWSDGLLSQLSF